MDQLEEYALVLSYLPTGKPTSPKPEPLVQLIGESYFTLLEAIPKVNDIKIGERVYIGKGDRPKIKIIKGRISYNDLTQGAIDELPRLIEEIIRSNEKRFVDFFNNAGPINIRMHSLELLPGIGKRHLDAILKERETKPFESFEDIEKRVPLLSNPVKLLVERVLIELKGETRFYILTKQFQKKEFS